MAVLGGAVTLSLARHQEAAAALIPLVLAEHLTPIDRRQRQLIELRFFAGLSLAEAAEVRCASAAAVKPELRRAKAWLHRALTVERPG
jgi:DNA-directed RNA polymerase specialized sigma24 family protein